MTPPAGELPTNYRFAELTLDIARRSVTRDGRPIELKALDFDLLHFLVESAPTSSTQTSSPRRFGAGTS